MQIYMYITLGLNTMYNNFIFIKNKYNTISMIYL